MRELIKSFSRLNKTAPVNERSIKSLLSPSIGMGAMDLGRTPDDSQLVLREVFGGFVKRGAPLELELSEDENPSLSKFKGSLKKIRRN